MRRQEGAAGHHPVMSEVYYLTDETGMKVATIARKPLRSVTEIGPMWTLVQFHNRPLYCNTWLPLWEQMRAMGFVFVCVAKVDVCADGERERMPIEQPIQCAVRNELRSYGKASWSVKFNPGSKHTVKRFDLGTRGGQKYVRAYCKSRELKSPAGAHKAQYIREAWYTAMMGEDPEANGQEVMRLEVSMKGKELEKFHADARNERVLYDIASASGCASIFASTLPLIYDFRYQYNGGDRSRDSIRAVEWDFTRTVDDPSRIRVMDRVDRVVTIGEVAIKTTCRTLWLNAQMVATTEQRDEFMRCLQTLVSANSLDRWFLAVEEKWVALYRKLTAKGNERYRQSVERLANDLPLT